MSSWFATRGSKATRVPNHILGLPHPQANFFDGTEKSTFLLAIELLSIRENKNTVANIDPKGVGKDGASTADTENAAVEQELQQEPTRPVPWKSFKALKENISLAPSR